MLNAKADDLVFSDLFARRRPRHRRYATEADPDQIVPAPDIVGDRRDAGVLSSVRRPGMTTEGITRIDGRERGLAPGHAVSD